MCLPPDEQNHPKQQVNIAGEEMRKRKQKQIKRLASGLEARRNFLLVMFSPRLSSICSLFFTAATTRMSFV